MGISCEIGLLWMPQNSTYDFDSGNGLVPSGNGSELLRHIANKATMSSMSRI